MHVTSTLLTIISLLRSSSAHYRFSHLIVNGTVTDEWQYVRDISPDNATKPIPVVPPYLKIIPQYPPDMFHPNIRCGRDAWMARPNNTERLTQTADVIAGSEVGFRVGVNVDFIRPTIFHEGPGQVYLARAPDDIPLSTWEGDGSYFKIAHAGAVNSTSWELFNPAAKVYHSDWNFTIPLTTPPGKYLMRIEHIFPHELNKTELYVNCAQINILGEGGGTPAGFARFPGTYQMDDPGINIPAGEESEVYKDFTKYGPAPGPAVWTG